MSRFQDYLESCPHVLQLPLKDKFCPLGWDEKNDAVRHLILDNDFGIYAFKTYYEGI